MYILISKKTSTLFFILFLIFLAQDAISQQNEIEMNDSLPPQNSRDSLSTPSRNVIENPIDYSARDSIVFDIENSKVFLFGAASVATEKMSLQADYIEFNMAENLVYASGIADSLGKLIGKPHFVDGSDEFDANEITYNFDTKRGVIHGVYTEQNDGYLHSDVIKKQECGHIHIAGGKYTTCDLEHPHFYIALTKAKVIPDEKIISGPLYFVIEDIPLPLFVPFGYLPDYGTYHSGFLIPSYGEETRRGFYLRDGGYYFSFNDYFDLALKGEIYSKGAWGVNAQSRYNLRYRYNGNINFRYNKIIESEEGLEDYKNSNSYSLVWSHTQDTKANPNATFSASVNFETNDYERYNATNLNNYLQNTKSSSITYRKTFPGTPFSLSANIRANQSTADRNVDLQRPLMTFNMNRIFPFKFEGSTGRKWYEKISISYSANFTNKISTKDTLLFTSSSMAQFKNGLQHNVPISANYKIFKYINVGPTFNYSARFYSNSIKKSWSNNYYYDLNGNLQTTGREVVDTISGLSHVYDFGFSLPLSTKLFGMYYPLIFKDKIEAIRHVASPSISYNYRPDFGEEQWGYYDSYTKITDTDTVETIYSYYDNGIYGTAPRGKSGSINFSLSNTLEMKVRSDKDTTDEGFKKIQLLESFSLNTSYNIAADSLNWSNLSVSARTRLFEMININLSSSFDPYAVDTNGTRINTFEKDRSGKIFRMKSLTATIGFSLNSEVFAGVKNYELPPIDGYYFIDYVDFKIPWNVSVNYSYGLTKTFDKKNQDFESTIRQSANRSGNLSLTEKWKISFRTNYDFEEKKVNATQFSLHRDLHCWEMSMSVIPFGRLQSYNFMINIKAAAFKDIQYKKNKSWYDYEY